MARFNEILVGRFNRALQKITGIKGPVPAPQLSSEIMPVIPLPLGAEFRYLESWDTYAKGVSLAAGGPATFNAVMLRNPPSSNVIAVLIRAFATNASAAARIQLYHAGGNTGDLGTLLNVVGGNERLDSRSKPVAATILSSQNNVGGVFSGGILIAEQDITVGLAAGDNAEFIEHPMHEVPILPGDTVEIINITANVGTMLGLWWRERYLEEGERA